MGKEGTWTCTRKGQWLSGLVLGQAPLPWMRSPFQKGVHQRQPSVQPPFRIHTSALGYFCSSGAHLNHQHAFLVKVHGFHFVRSNIWKHMQTEMTMGEWFKGRTDRKLELKNDDNMTENSAASISRQLPLAWWAKCHQISNLMGRQPWKVGWRGGYSVRLGNRNPNSNSL